MQVNCLESSLTHIKLSNNAGRRVDIRRERRGERGKEENGRVEIGRDTSYKMKRGEEMKKRREMEGREVSLCREAGVCVEGEGSLAPPSLFKPLRAGSKFNTGKGPAFSFNIQTSFFFFFFKL